MTGIQRSNQERILNGKDRELRTILPKSETDPFVGQLYAKFEGIEKSSCGSASLIYFEDEFALKLLKKKGIKTTFLLLKYNKEADNIKLDCK